MLQVLFFVVAAFAVKLDKKLGKEILEFQNKMRLEIGTLDSFHPLPKGEIGRLFWNKVVATRASDFADKCETESNEQDLKNYNIGEVIFESKSDISEAIKEFEAHLFLQSKNLPHEIIKNYKPDDKYNNFTQAIWSNTTYIGCGYNDKCKNLNKTLLICNYYNRGNINGQPVYGNRTKNEMYFLENQKMEDKQSKNKSKNDKIPGGLIDNLYDFKKLYGIDISKVKKPVKYIFDLMQRIHQKLNVSMNLLIDKVQNKIDQLNKQPKSNNNNQEKKKGKINHGNKTKKVLQFLENRKGKDEQSQNKTKDGRINNIHKPKKSNGNHTPKHKKHDKSVSYLNKQIHQKYHAVMNLLANKVQHRIDNLKKLLKNKN